MPLKINLYHEVLRARREEQYDPLRLSLIGVVVIIAALAAYYLFALTAKNAVLEELAAKKRDHDELVPKVEKAKIEEQELNKTLQLAEKMTKRMEERFYWGPMFEQIVAIAPDNVQITRFNGDLVGEAGTRAQLSIEGIVAGEEPRRIAEQLRVNLNQSLTQKYKEVNSTYKDLQESPERIEVNGARLPTASFNINVTFVVRAAPTPTPAPRRAKKAAAATESETE